VVRLLALLPSAGTDSTFAFPFGRRPSQYDGLRTTPMDDYRKLDCIWDDSDFDGIFPHTTTQCECKGAVVHVPNDTMALYRTLRDDINANLYNGRFEDDITSCSPQNQALVWLSSGNTRDSGDIYQRYTMAVTYIQMNGTRWDLDAFWMDDDSECTWLGLGCDGRFRINNFAIDVNNIHGKIPSELAFLESLRTISLSRNHVSGTIPREVYAMSSLESIFLYTNMIVGNIPTDIHRPGVKS